MCCIRASGYVVSSQVDSPAELQVGGARSGSPAPEPGRRLRPSGQYLRGKSPPAPLPRQGRASVVFLAPRGADKEMASGRSERCMEPPYLHAPRPRAANAPGWTGHGRERTGIDRADLAPDRTLGAGDWDAWVVDPRLAGLGTRVDVEAKVRDTPVRRRDGRDPHPRPDARARRGRSASTHG